MSNHYAASPQPSVFLHAFGTQLWVGMDHDAIVREGMEAVAMHDARDRDRIAKIIAELETTLYAQTAGDNEFAMVLLDLAAWHLGQHQNWRGILLRLAAQMETVAEQMAAQGEAEDAAC